MEERNVFRRLSHSFAPHARRKQRHLKNTHPLLLNMMHHAWGHAQCVWDLRQIKKLAAGHAEFHKCTLEDMLVSFDGVNFSAGAGMNVRGRPRGEFRGNCWRHLDQRLSDGCSATARKCACRVGSLPTTSALATRLCGSWRAVTITTRRLRRRLACTAQPQTGTS